MPVYCYKCSSCEKEFEARHSMSFSDQRCIACDSEDVFKVPSLNLDFKPQVKSPRTGKVVDEYIRDVKKEVQLEKKKLRSREL